MEMVWIFPGPVFVRLAKQECHLHATRRSRHSHLVDSAWRAGASLDFAPANRKMTVCGCGCFHHYAGPDPRVHELLRLSIFVRRRSLAVFGEPLLS